MVYEIFQKEKQVIEDARARLSDENLDEASRSTYGALLSEYERLLKVTRRMVSLSESNENKLREANEKIAHQKEELERRQDELVQAEKMASLGQLVAGVAHELNTPLGIILTSATTLQSETQALSERLNAGAIRKSDVTKYTNLADEACALMVRHSDGASDLIRAFKALSVDQVIDELREISVVDYIEDVLISLKPMFKGSQVEMRCLGDRSLTIRTNPGPFSQVVTNLVLNAFKHGFESGMRPGYIEIDCETNGETLHMVVKDNGKGLDPAIADTLFDPFVTTARDEGGTGLGLHLVHNIMTAKLQGRIAVGKNKEGSGCVFDLHLPLALKFGEGDKHDAR